MLRLNRIKKICFGMANFNYTYLLAFVILIAVPRFVNSQPQNIAISEIFTYSTEKQYIELRFTPNAVVNSGHWLVTIDVF